MRLLITGREGQLARSLAERSVHHPALELAFAGRPEVDLERPGALADAIAAARPEVVINAAAFTDVDRAEDEPDRAMRINGEAAGEAARAAADGGAAIIQISTDYVFDGRAAEPYRQDSPTGPINIYGESKLVGEQRVIAANPRHLILRTSWLVGPFGRNFVKTMLRLAAGQDEIRVVADQVGNPTGTLMLADAILAIAERWRDPALADTGLGQIFHVAGIGACSWAELAEAVMAASAAAGGPSARIVPIPSAAYPTKARRPACSALDSGKFERLFHFPVVAWQPMVTELVARLVSAEGPVR